MFYAYILRSLKDGTHYYGHTADMDERLKIHNRGKVRYTKGHYPYVLHYFEEYSSKSEAARREIFFKSIDGHNWLREQRII